MSEKMVLTHLWQEQGLGKAPFRAVCIISMPSKSVAEHNPQAYNNACLEAGQQAKAFGVHLCSCDSCGQSLTNNVVIRDSQGAHFVVGLDCASKTGDSQLIKNTKYLEKQRQKELRRKRAEKKRREQIEARHLELESQRERNGGLTDQELAAEKANRERLEREKQITEENLWLIKALNQAYQSDFVDSIREDLKRKQVKEFSDRCLNILCDIYAKTHGRRNSKAYREAESVFWSRANT